MDGTTFSGLAIFLAIATYVCILTVLNQATMDIIIIIQSTLVHTCIYGARSIIIMIMLDGVHEPLLMCTI